MEISVPSRLGRNLQDHELLSEEEAVKRRQGGEIQGGVHHSGDSAKGCRAGQARVGLFSRQSGQHLFGDNTESAEAPRAIDTLRVCADTDKAGEVQLRDINLTPRSTLSVPRSGRHHHGDIFSVPDVGGVQFVMDRFLRHRGELPADTPFQSAYREWPGHQRAFDHHGDCRDHHGGEHAVYGIPLGRGVERFFPFLAVVVLTTLCLLSLMFVIRGGPVTRESSESSADS